MRQSGNRASGYTVIEIVVAITVLAAGSAVLWYGLRSSAQIDRLNAIHHAAVLLARSDLESLRGAPKEDIHDTVYLGPGIGSDSLILVRTVMDSARIVDTLEELVLDERYSPKELRKPLEVRVRVYPGRGEDAAAFDADSFLRRIESGQDALNATDAEDEAAPRALVSLVLMLPEYKWY